MKQLVIENDRLDFYDANGAEIIARQQLTPVYHRNGVAYAMTRECLIAKESIIGERMSFVIIDDVMVNIDTEIDLKLAEIFLKQAVTEKA